MADHANETERARWSGHTGQAWADHQAALDATHLASQALLMAEAQIAPGHQVLDIGCGSGASTLEAARLAGANGHAVGLDISAPLLAIAMRRARDAGLSVSFHEADAQTTPLREASIVRVISRFGAMFFADPVAAFTNIARAMRAGGRITMIAWGPLADNPWFAIPREAAVARFGEPAPRDPHAPGPLAFADPARVGELLKAAGLDIETAEHRTIALTPPGGIPGTTDLMFRFGPAGRMLSEAGGTDTDAAAIRAGIANAVAHYAKPDGIAIPACLSLLAARRP